MLAWLRSSGRRRLGLFQKCPSSPFFEGLLCARHHSEFYRCLLSWKPPTTALRGGSLDHLHFIDEGPEAFRGEIICLASYTSKCQSQDLSPVSSASGECVPSLLAQMASKVALRNPCLLVVTPS